MKKTTIDTSTRQPTAGTLVISGERKVKRPSPNQIKKTLGALRGTDDAFAVYEKDDTQLVYMQTSWLSGDDFELEYQAGSVNEHFVCKYVLSLEDVQNAFIWYAKDDDRWHKNFAWQTLEIAQSPLQHIELMRKPSDNRRTQSILATVQENMVNPCESYGADGWIWSHTSKTVEFETRFTGKWMLFISCPSAVEGWRLINEATTNGLLGISAKVAREDQTSQPKIRRNFGPEHVFCIYTYDWRDLADVLLVGQTLVKLGAVNLQADSTIYYKADQQTLDRVSASIFQLKPPYNKIEPTFGLAAWAKTEPEASEVLSWLNVQDAEGIPQRVGIRISS